MRRERVAGDEQQAGNGAGKPIIVRHSLCRGGPCNNTSNWSDPDNCQCSNLDAPQTEASSFSTNTYCTKQQIRHGRLKGSNEAAAMHILPQVHAPVDHPERCCDPDQQVCAVLLRLPLPHQPHLLPHALLCDARGVSSALGLG